MSDVLAVLSGFLVGLLSGVIGIGGGVLLVPVMVIAFRFGQHVAQGTSLVAIIPISLVGAVTHQREGHVNLPAAAWMGLVGVAGALAGAELALHLHPQVLARLFGFFLVVSALRVWPRLKKGENQD